MDNKFINNTSFSEIDEEKFIYYFKKFIDGDYSSLDILVNANMKLVYWYIDNYIICNRDEYDEIFSVSCEALMESFYKYDFNKGVKFSTFLITCIRNKILKYFRNEKKYKNIISLDEEMYDDSDIIFKDMIIDNSSFEEDIVDRYDVEYKNNIIMLELEKLSEVDRKIIGLYFGFIDGKIYGQSEISRMIGLSQGYISKRISRVLKQIRNRIVLLESEDNKENKILKKVA